MNYLRGVRLRELPEPSDYLSRLPMVRQLARLDALEFSKPVTFFVGENGTGKSTLLEAIALVMGFNPEGGSRDFRFSTRDSHSALWKCLTPIRTVTPLDGFFLRAESFYNTASFVDRQANLERYGGISFHDQSHGEAFLSLVTNRFQGNGLYLLDEPESALSPQRLLSLMAAIDQLVQANSQFLIATHSPILMAYPKAEILYFDETGIRPMAYRDTEHYKITKQFLEHPEQMLRYLLEP